MKSKEGVVERIGSSGYEVICKGMFKKETDLANLFAGLRVSLSTGEAGKIEDSFGQGYSQINDARHMVFRSSNSLPQRRVHAT